MKDTRERILNGALRVFARDGIMGATTREISRVAKVNEVTLFRYFRSKNELLRQMVLQSCHRYEQVFAVAALKSPEDLRKTVRDYAETCAHKFQENEGLIRTFISELRRHVKLSRRLFVESSQASREKFIAYLKSAQKARLVRRDIDPVAATDALTGMLMAGTLRRPLTESMYAESHYVDTCIDLFLKGIEQ
jgi:AcrR family transcriptional regulator